MNRRLARAIVSRFRPFEGGTHDFRCFGVKEWQQTLDWLDDSGLALYFLRYLQTTQTTESIPPQILLRLELNSIHNCARWERLAEEFARVNKEFQLAEMPFAVIKGLSLVPDYCPDTRLRAPSDLDFLIEREDLPIASRVLENLGYRPKNKSDIELQFWKPTPKMPTASDDPYSVGTEALIELHFRFWEGTHRISLTEPLFSLGDVVSHSWHGLQFPALDKTNAFLLQIIHVFQHITTYWVKLCWLLEIGWFMSKHLSDTEFWLKVDARMQQHHGLVEFAAIVVSLARNVFGSPTSDIADNWINHLRPGSQLWLDEYAETWAIDDHPYRRSAFFRAAKLALFLHQEYVPDQTMRKEVILNQLFPWKRPDVRVSFPTDYEPARTLTSLSTRGKFAADRMMFHAGATLRYLCEVPRWHYRVRHSSQQA
jgi:hypothetical protein